MDIWQVWPTMWNANTSAYAALLIKTSEDGDKDIFPTETVH